MTVYEHPMARRASEERVACFMAALTCGVTREAFIGLAFRTTPAREARPPRDAPTPGAFDVDNRYHGAHAAACIELAQQLDRNDD